MSNEEKKYLTWQLMRKGNYYNGSITDEMLKEIDENFKKNGEIPIGVGHMRSFFDDSLPADGWINPKQNHGIDAKGNFYTSGVNLFEPLKSLYSEGRYKNWSVVISRPRIYDEKKDQVTFGKWQLEAVDMLGRATPAIKNLKDLTSKQADISKFTVDPENENIIKFTETGREMELMHFSFSGEIEEQTTDNIDEGKNMNEIEKQLAEMKEQLEANQKAFADITAKNKEEIERLTAERDKAAKSAEESMKKFANEEKAKLSKVLSKVPEDLQTNLYDAIEKAKCDVSIYGILADCFNQLVFTSNPEITADMPGKDDPNYENEAKKLYSDGRALTRKMFSNKK
jgi:hypothetical protein